MLRRFVHSPRSRYDITAPAMRAVSVLSMASSALLAIACHREVVNTPPPRPPVVEPAPVTPRRLELDAARMAVDIATLAADDFNGRYTLSPDLRRAAELLARRHGELGLSPVGADFMIDFPLRTGARLREPARLETFKPAKPGGAGTPTAFAGQDFVVLPQSGSGAVRGELVFAGYAAQSEPPKPADGASESGTDTGTGGGSELVSPPYDDLAGVDLKGKVALVLLEAPGRPDPMMLFTRLQEEAQRFTDAATPLKAAGDLRGLTKLHARAQKRLYALLRPFMPQLKAKELWPLPEDVASVEFDLQKMAGGLMREAAKMPGPRFAIGEGGLKRKVERLVKAGAVAVITVRGPRSFLSPVERDADELPRLEGGEALVGESLAVPVVQVKWKSVDRLLGGRKLSKLQAQIDGERTPRSGPLGRELALSVALQPVNVQVPNVLASLPGGDLSHEIVMIGAHYDHIGVAGAGQCGEAKDGEKLDTICNGADDNASGTAMLLELARAWKQSGLRPRRTIVFTHFAGEELGVLGSKALVEAPPFDLKRVVAMINLDMIGRLGTRGLAIGGLGSSERWMPLLDEVGPAGLEVLYEGSVATRSDHASFYRKDIPVLFFFTGVHSDYHRPGDHSDKINLVGMRAIGEIVAGVLLRLGDGYKVPWRPPGANGGLSQGLPGSDPATVVKRVQATGTAANAKPGSTSTALTSSTGPASTGPTSTAPTSSTGPTSTTGAAAQGGAAK